MVQILSQLLPPDGGTNINIKELEKCEIATTRHRQHIIGQPIHFSNWLSQFIWETHFFFFNSRCQSYDSLITWNQTALNAKRHCPLYVSYQNEKDRRKMIQKEKHNNRKTKRNKEYDHFYSMQIMGCVGNVADVEIWRVQSWSASPLGLVCLSIFIHRWQINSPSREPRVEYFPLFGGWLAGRNRLGKKSIHYRHHKYLCAINIHNTWSDRHHRQRPAPHRRNGLYPFFSSCFLPVELLKRPAFRK